MANHFALSDVGTSDASTSVGYPNKTDAEGRWERGTLAIILLFAASVRLLGITFGLPYVFYPDEALIVNHAMAFGTGDLNPHYFVYPSLYMYVLFILYGIIYVAGRVLGIFASSDDFIHLFFTDATIFYLPGRLIAAFSGIATVCMVYKVGRRAYNAHTGLISAVLLTVGVLHVSYSHYVKTHVPAGLLVIITLWFAWAIYEGRKSWRPYVAAGATAGLAASTVYHAGLAVISIIVAHLLSTRCGMKRRFFDLKLLVAACASFVAFVFTTPFAILDFSTFVSDLTSTGGVYYGGGIWERDAFYPFTSLLSSFGQPLGTVALVSLGYALFRRRPVDLIIASQPIFLGLFLMMFRVKEAPHMLVAFPAISLLAASFVMDATQWLSRKRVALHLGRAIVTGALILIPAQNSLEWSYRLSLPDTRLLAKTWVEENIPFGSKILMDSGKYYLGAYGPPLALSRWTLEHLINRGTGLAAGSVAQREGTRRLGYSGESAYFKYQAKVWGDRPGYDIVQILHDMGSATTALLSVNQYVDQGVEYVIVSSYARDAYSSAHDESARYPDKIARYGHFYNCLEHYAVLIKEFSPSATTVGPTLRIYKMRYLPCGTVGFSTFRHLTTVYNIH